MSYQRNDLPTGGERAALVEEMFDRIAGRYELLNTVMTGGMHRIWNRRIIKAANVIPGDRVLDLACGTGSLTRDIAARVGESGSVLGVDFSREMLRGAESRPLPNVEYRRGDATDLSFLEDETFDAVTIAYGARNIPNLDKLFAEMRRVVRPGGRVVCLEIATPESKASRAFYGLWFDRVVPKLGARISGDAEAYTYLPKSVKEFVAADDLSGIIERNGLQDVTYRRLAGGIITLHRGVRGL